MSAHVEIHWCNGEWVWFALTGEPERVPPFPGACPWHKDPAVEAWGLSRKRTRRDAEQRAVNYLEYGTPNPPPWARLRGLLR